MTSNIEMWIKNTLTVWTIKTMWPYLFKWKCIKRKKKYGKPVEMCSNYRYVNQLVTTFLICGIGLHMRYNCCAVSKGVVVNSDVLAGLPFLYQDHVENDLSSGLIFIDGCFFRSLPILVTWYSRLYFVQRRGFISFFEFRPSAYYQFVHMILQFANIWHRRNIWDFYLSVT